MTFLCCAQWEHAGSCSLEYQWDMLCLVSRCYDFTLFSEGHCISCSGIISFWCPRYPLALLPSQVLQEMGSICLQTAHGFNKSRLAYRAKQLFFFSPLYHFSVPWDFTSELLGNKLECSIWRWKGETRETAQWIPVLLSSLWFLGEGPIFAMRLLPHSWSGVCCHQENTVNMEPADFGYALALL